MRLTAALLLASATCAFAGQYSLALKPENTRIEWTLGDVLHTVHGTFRLKSGAIEFDSDTGKASGKIVIDVASGNSGSAARDKRMHASVLESKKYPDAVFTPDHIEGRLDLPGASEVKVHGTFTIHGGSHELTMNTKTQATEDSMNVNLTFQIPYVAWGMKDPSNFLLKVNKTVDITVATSGVLEKH